MTSKTEDRLDEISRALQILIENSLLTKIDLMFSVLVSFAIFGAGLLLNNLSLPANSEQSSLLNLLVAFFAVLVYTLVGEAYSILKDDLATRFGFWLALLSNFLFLAYLSFVAYVLRFLTFITGFVLLPIGYILILVALYGLEEYQQLFWKYARRFPTRFPNAQESFARETPKLLKPTVFGMVVYFVCYLILSIYTIVATL